MKRQLVFDTETTGLFPDNGDRVVELCAVELIDGVKTGDYFLTLLNPERSIPDEVVRIHHIDDAKVKNAPIFKDVADKFLEYIKGAELIIHNADFDIKMMNMELDKINKGKLWDYISNSIDTVKMSRRLYSDEKKHSLDAMCIRFGLDLSEREKSGHGAFIDCQLLADCYIKMISEHPIADLEAEIAQKNWVRPPIKRYEGLILPEVKLTEREEKLHELFLEKLAEKSSTTPIFTKLGSASRPTM
jgi:DNA polymerase-3 subunit epsilon